jgi:hypothetical protein
VQVIAFCPFPLSESITHDAWKDWVDPVDPAGQLPKHVVNV